MRRGILVLLHQWGWSFCCILIYLQWINFWSNKCKVLSIKLISVFSVSLVLVLSAFCPLVASQLVFCSKIFSMCYAMIIWNVSFETTVRIVVVLLGGHWAGLSFLYVMIIWFWKADGLCFFYKQVSGASLNIHSFGMFVSSVHLWTADDNLNHSWIFFCCSCRRFNPVCVFHLFLSSLFINCMFFPSINSGRFHDIT